MTTSVPSSRPPATSNRGFLLIVLGLAIVGLAVVAYVATRSGDDGEGSVTLAEEQTAPVALDGDVLDPLPSGVSLGTADNDPVVGSTAPSLTAADFEGNEVTIGADGRPKVVYFLAHWCPHCQAEVGVIQELIDDGSLPEGLDLYAVSTAVDEGRGNFPPQSWLAEEGFEPLAIRDDAASSAFASFGGSGFPYAVYLNGENGVLARSAGEVEAATIVDLWASTAAS